jgi:hypothetical protein
VSWSRSKNMSTLMLTRAAFGSESSTVMQPISIPQQPDDISPEWLTQALQRSGVLSGDVRVDQISLGDPGREASYAGYVTRLTIDYEPTHVSAPRTVIGSRCARHASTAAYRSSSTWARSTAAGRIR